jgi:hypothetical protein
MIWEKTRSGAEVNNEAPLARSAGGIGIISVLIIILSLAFLGLIDRQPSPPGSSRQIGNRPGFTFGGVTDLFPYELFSINIFTTVVACAVCIAALHFVVSGKLTDSMKLSVIWSLALSVIYSVTIFLTVWFNFEYYTGICEIVPNPKTLIVNNLSHLWLLAIALICQVVVLFTTLILYQQPLIPADVVPETESQLPQFEQYMQNSWRLTQMGLSAGVAVAVGVSLPILVETSINLLDTILVAGILLSGAFALLLFPAFRIYYAGKVRRDVTKQALDSVRGFE